MKLLITSKEFDEIPLINQLFLALWREEKGYSQSKEWSFGEVIELALSLNNELVYDTPLERTVFNNSLPYEEFSMSWDGDEPLTILWYEFNKKLHKRIIQHMVVSINN